MRCNLFVPWPLLVMLLLLAVGLPAHAACTAGNLNASVIESTPIIDFAINSDGTVSHTKTGLMWKRCAEGWSGAGCSSGTATHSTWANALKAANIANNAAFAGYTDWRLPNKKELESIVELCGVSPAINQTVFPANPSVFWSGSSYVPDPSFAWVVGFDDGVTTHRSKSGSSSFVRLVRSGQSVDSFDALNLTVPGAPTIVSVTPGNRRAKITFSAPEPENTGGTAITGYRFTRIPGDTFSGTLDRFGPSIEPFIFLGLVNLKAYTFTVRAFNSVGPGPESALSNSVTPKSPLLVNPPTGVSATPGNGRATITFMAPIGLSLPGMGGTTIIGYRFTRFPTGLTGPATVRFRFGPSTEPFIFQPLTNGLPSTFRVTGYNGEGLPSPESALSNSVIPTPASFSP